MRRAAIPLCPACGYDQSGAVAAWAESCPLEARCTECGSVWASRLLFGDEAGPRWSVEHAKRRLVRKWLWTTSVTLRPRKLWSELRPEDPLRPRRLAGMAVVWLALLQLTAAALIGASATLCAVLPGPDYGAWRYWDPGSAAFWMGIARWLAWPYNGWIVLPTGPNSSIGNPISEFVLVAALPQLAMGGLVLLWARARGVAAHGHRARAAALVLPGVCFWTVLLTVAFAAVALLELYWPAGPLPLVIVVGSLAAMTAWMVWYWRCFVAEYLGRPGREWVYVLLALASLVAAWFMAWGISEVTR